MRARSRASVFPRQSSSALIRASISFAGDAVFAPGFFMRATLP